MVTAGDAARKRIRDYSAERRRRNERAREQGFTSLDQLAKARRSGVFPTAKAIRTDPAERKRAADVTAQRRAGTKDARQLAEWDKRSARWSRQHSRQDGTTFDRSWPAEQRAGYFRAFVQQWQIPSDERDFAPTYDYMRKYPTGFEPERLDHNPYGG